MSSGIPISNKPRIIIVGGGFGGLLLAKKLSGSNYQVVLIDRHNYHTFQPLLYQVATGGLESGSIAHPLRRLLKNHPNVYFRMAELHSVEPENKTISTSIGEIPYDYLVLATGSKTNFFGNKETEEHAMRLKTIPQALDLRSLILQNLEQALLDTEIGSRERNMNFLVVGGGPTGVETAGALGELKNHVLPKDYPELDIRRMQIHLIEAGPRVLAGMSDHASEKALKFLQELDVNVWLNTQLMGYDGSKVTFSKGSLDTNMVLWTAGVIGAIPTGLPEACIVRGNRIAVDEFNRIPSHPEILVIGDLAFQTEEKYPKGYPGVAPVAMQHAKNVARNFIRQSKNKTLVPFKYFDKGSMATIGRNKAVVDLGRFRFSGFFAWFVWMTVHLISLVGFRNKIIVLIDWFWNYISYDRATRLILRPFKKT